MATIDEMALRSAWKIRHGLHDMPTSALVTKSISKSERNAGMLAPAGQKTLTEICQESDEYQRAKRYNEIFSLSSRKRDGPGM